MIQTRPLYLTLACGLLWITLVSCGGGNGGGLTGQGSVEGFAYVNSQNAVILSRSATPPAGTTPLSGATVRVVGTSVTGQTESNGHFLLSGIQAGLRKLRLEAPGIPATEIPITLIGDAMIQAGAPTISRQAAIDRMMQRATQVAAKEYLLIVGSQNPLPPGVTVYPAMVDRSKEVDSSKISRFEREQWFFYVDAYSSHLFQHPVQYIFVDAQTGEVTVKDADSWPLINGVEFYRDHDDNQTSADNVLTPTAFEIEPPTTRAASIRPETPTRHHVPGCESPQTYALLLQGGDEIMMYSTKDRLLATLDALGVPVGNRYYIFPTNPQNPHASLANALNGLKSRAQPCDTVLVFIIAHGYRPGGPTQGGAIDVDYNVGTGILDLFSGEREVLTPEEFNFSGLKACHLHIFIDCCWSGSWIAPLSAQLLPKTGLDASIITSTDRDHRGIAHGVRHLLLGQSPGLFFSKYFAEAVSSLGAPYNPVQAYSRITNRIADDTKGISWGGAYARMGINKNPQIWVRPRQPNETCGPDGPGTGTQTNRPPRLVKLENTFLPEAHSNRFVLEAADDDGDSLTYAWSWSGPAAVCGADRGADGGRPYTRIFYHEGCSFADESETTVTVIVSDGKGGTKTYTHGLRQEGSFDLTGKAAQPTASISRKTVSR